jgi:hypothetical protein
VNLYAMTATQAHSSTRFSAEDFHLIGTFFDFLWKMNELRHRLIWAATFLMGF